jgi:hypothetical protein
MACALAILGFGVKAASSIAQNNAAKEQKSIITTSANRQAEALKEQAALAQRQADIANARQLRAQIRQRRIAEGALLNSAANAGTQFSSSAQGGLASLGSQTNSNIAFINQNADINSRITKTQVDQATTIQNAATEMAGLQYESATYGALGSLGGTIFSDAGGFKTIFGKPQPTQAPS